MYDLSRIMAEGLNSIEDMMETLAELKVKLVKLETLYNKASELVTNKFIEDTKDIKEIEV